MILVMVVICDDSRIDYDFARGQLDSFLVLSPWVPALLHVELVQGLYGNGMRWPM